MGMSIDEAIRRIEVHNRVHQMKEPRAIYISEAFDVAKDTMQKYQKIEQIINCRHTKSVSETLDEIIKVLL